MKHYRLATIVVMALALAGCSKNPSKPTTPGMIMGTVLDTLGGLIPGTLAGATVTTDPATDSVVTDHNGRFFIGGLVEGHYAIRVTKDGYFGSLASVPVLSAETTKVTIYARPRPWLSAAALPEARHAFGSAVLGTQAYVIAGIAIIGSTTRYSSVFSYDPSANLWTSTGLAPLPWYLESPACASTGGLIYSFGGSTGSNDTNMTEAYDFLANNWSTKAPMPTLRRAMAAAVVNGKIYVFGGFHANTPLDTVEVYDPTANSWASCAKMPAPRGGLSAAVVNGLVYVFGGSNGVAECVDTYEYNPANNTWSAKASLPAGRSYMACAAVNNAVYLFGGKSGTTAQGAVYRYTPATNAWAVMDPMPTARYSAGAYAINGRIYIFGGFNGTNSLTTAEVYNPLADPGK